MKTEHTETCSIPICAHGTLVGHVIRIDRYDREQGALYCAHALLFDKREVQTERDTRERAVQGVIEDTLRTVGAIPIN